MLYDQGAYSKAALVLLKASRMGHREVDYWLGRSYLAMDEKKGEFPGKLAEYYLRFAAKQGHLDAIQLLAEKYGIRDYQLENAAAQSEPEPKPALKTETPDQDVEAIFQAGMTSYTNEDYTAALSSFEQAADHGHVEAQFHCGMMHDKGKGTAKDKAKALYWYESAAKQGHANAQFKCGEMYRDGEGTAEDMTKALYWYEKAAEQGNVIAQNNCGRMYSRGEGTAVNQAKALHWYEKAAEQGNTAAQIYCSVRYEKGRGTAVNRKKAQYWQERCVKESSVADKLRIASDYSMGSDELEKDEAKSLFWYEKAAEQGDIESQFLCGMMYFAGKGTARDKAKAKSFFQKVAAQTEDKYHQERAKKYLREKF